MEDAVAMEEPTMSEGQRFQNGWGGSLYIHVHINCLSASVPMLGRAPQSSSPGLVPATKEEGAYCVRLLGLEDADVRSYGRVHQIWMKEVRRGLVG